MMRSILRPGIWALTIGFAGAATATASSITTYGSIVLSTLGTEGMSTVTADSSLSQPANVNVATDSAATVGGSNGTTANNPTATVGGSRPTTGGGGGGGASGSRSSAPVAAAGNPAVNAPTADVVSTPVLVPAPSDTVVDPVQQTPTGTPREEIPLPPVDTTTRDPDTIFVGPPVQMETPASDTVSETSTNDTPEPATLTLLGLAGVGGWWRARRKK